MTENYLLISGTTSSAVVVVGVGVVVVLMVGTVVVMVAPVLPVTASC